MKTSMLGAVGAAALGGLSLARGAHAAGSDVIRIGLIGCGGRGPGAALNAMNVDRGVRLVAMTDIFADKVQSRRAMLKQQKPDQVQVDDAHCFSGLDGYRHVIESAEVVLIACAAKYHCYYLHAAVKAGKHVFVEKPHAIDPVGVRRSRPPARWPSRRISASCPDCKAATSPAIARPSSESTTEQSATSCPCRKRGSAAPTG